MITTYKFDKDSVLVDQYSDVNVVSSVLANEIKLRRRPLTTLGLKGVTLLDSPGKTNPISEYVVLNAMVEGIPRSVWAVIQPHGAHDDTVLLLPLPWLWDVMVNFDIPLRL